MQELKVGGSARLHHGMPFSPPSSRAESCLTAFVPSSFLSSNGSGCLGPSSVVEATTVLSQKRRATSSPLR